MNGPPSVANMLLMNSTGENDSTASLCMDPKEEHGTIASKFFQVSRYLVNFAQPRSRLIDGFREPRLIDENAPSGIAVHMNASGHALVGWTDLFVNVEKEQSNLPY